jgi:hypothetical protein
MKVVKWIKEHPATIGMWIAVAITLAACVFMAGFIVWLVIVAFDVLWPALVTVIVVVAVMAAPNLMEMAEEEKYRRGK